MSWLGRPLLVASNVLVYALLLFPLIIVVGISFAPDVRLDFPPNGLSLRWFEYIAGRPELLDAFAVSLVLALLVAVLALVLGILAALALARYQFRGKQAIEALLLAPLVVPSLIVGVALLQTFSLVGFMDSFPRLILGHLVLTIPFAVRSIGACLYGIDRSLEESALVMGASPFKTFRRVLLPLLRPGIVVGALFAFIVSFGNITISIFMVSAETVTLPIRILTYLQWQFDPSIAAISTVLVVFTLALLLTAERTLGLTKLRALQA
jgi:putative spermidine/putrescine transport system permease protein